MSDGLAETFATALRGPSDKAIAVSHRWLRVFVQNHGGHAALVIRAALAPDQSIADGRGYRVKTERGGADDYVRFTAEAEGVPLIFLKLVEMILERAALEPTTADAIESIGASVEDFRGFFGRRGDRLSENEVRGLFAELRFLRTLLERGLDPAIAVAAWHGPFALHGLGERDFVFSNGSAVEIKSLHLGAKRVTVSSPTQLIPTPNDLHLVVLEVDQAIGVDVPSFRSFANELGRMISESGATAASAWSDAISALGLELDDEWYDRFKFTGAAWLCYSVSSGFPHLNISSIQPAITSISYALELSYLSSFTEPFDEVLTRIGR